MSPFRFSRDRRPPVLKIAIPPHGIYSFRLTAAGDFSVTLHLAAGDVTILANIN